MRAGGRGPDNPKALYRLTELACKLKVKILF